MILNFIVILIKDKRKRKKFNLTPVLSDEENKDSCCFVELENGEVVEICNDDLGISPYGLGIPCEQDFW